MEQTYLTDINLARNRSLGAESGRKEHQAKGYSSNWIFSDSSARDFQCLILARRARGKLFVLTCRSASFGVRRGWKLGASRKIWQRKLFSSFYLTCSSGKLVDKLTPRPRSFLWSFNLISRKVLQLLYRGSHKNLKRCRWISGEFISLKSLNIKGLAVLAEQRIDLSKEHPHTSSM